MSTKLDRLHVFLILKSFDTVNRKIILEKFGCYGIRGESLKLNTSYLANWKQFVKDPSVKSQLKTIIEGVPQG